MRRQPLPTKQRMWIVCYLAKDNEGLIQGYRVKVVSSCLAGAAGIVESWLENKDHFITDIGIAADECSLGDGPELDPLADSLDWPW